MREAPLYKRAQCPIENGSMEAQQIRLNTDKPPPPLSTPFPTTAHFIPLPYAHIQHPIVMRLCVDADFDADAARFPVADRAAANSNRNRIRNRNTNVSQRTRTRRALREIEG